MILYSCFEIFVQNSKSERTGWINESKKRQKHANRSAAHFYSVLIAARKENRVELKIKK